MNAGDCFNLTNKMLRKLVEGRPVVFLDVSFCRSLTNEALRHIQYSGIEDLNLEGCKKMDGFGLLNHMHTMPLTRLNLARWVHLENKYIQGLQGMTDLRTLNLNGCAKLTDPSLCWLRGMPLTDLNVSGTGYTNKGLWAANLSGPRGCMYLN